jgi:hypothetical protein
LEDEEGDGRITLSLIPVSFVAVMGDKLGLLILTSVAVFGSSGNSTAGVVTGLNFDFKGSLNSGCSILGYDTLQFHTWL